MLLMHPKTYEWFKLQIKNQGLVLDRLFGDMPDFAGLKVQPSDLVPRFHKKWVFPDHPGVEYEPSDERWCRYFGIGHEVDDTNNPAIFNLAEPSFAMPSSSDAYRDALAWSVAGVTPNPAIQRYAREIDRRIMFSITS